MGPRGVGSLSVAAVVSAVVLLGCAAEPEAVTRSPAAATPSATAAERAGRASPSPSTGPVERPSRGPVPSEGRPTRSTISIPALDLEGLQVVPYRGWTDDARGTRIQNAGDLASPHGPRGGVGPGGIGNYQVTGHRLSSTMPFRHLPALSRGSEVRVDAGGTRYVYRIVATRWTSFRSPSSLREQRAAVPGRPGAKPRRAMITLSTCATIEDHAAGNFWSDRFGNPEHRIDKIGVLDRVVRRP